MPNFSGMATTYDLPNYGGELFLVTPTDTPLLTAMGGLQQRGEELVINSTEWTWQTEDLGAAAQPAVLEGANASFTERTRSNFSNVVQIFQYGVSVSYTKLAANAQLAAISADTNPVVNELDHQIQLKLKTAARDINYTFINGVYQKPVDNTTARKTRGLLAAITTQSVSGLATAVAFTGAAATDLITSTAHGLAAGDQIVLTGGSLPTGLVAATTYFVRDVSANTFKLAATSGGAAIDITVDGSGSYQKCQALSKTMIDLLLDGVYQQRGVHGELEPTLVVNSTQKRQLSKIYVTDANFQEMSREVGGVNLQQIETDFGRINIMMDRAVPSDKLLFTHLGMLKPKFLLIPSKGFLFVEELSKSGASEQYQLYGEIGLEYGDEAMHGKISNLAV